MTLLDFLRNGRRRPGEHPLAAGRAPAVPADARVYAIGDIHGRLDLLLEIEALIDADLRQAPWTGSLFVIHLGDYVDRGPASAGVIDHLVNAPRRGATTVFLCGNHDYWFRQALKGDPPDHNWLVHGGDVTLSSYRFERAYDASDPTEAAAWHRALRRAVPPGHQRFLEQLDLSVQLGDYLFCHAGIRPGVPLDLQYPTDLMWIREDFLDHDGDLGVVVVHGHTIVGAPEIRPHRIGIDTGAVRTGRLTCLVLEGETRRFLVTGDNQD